MDFDILLFGQHQINQAGLTVPHPRLHLRRFVLEPLVEIDPTYIHPTLHRSLNELLEDLDDTSQVKNYLSSPGRNIAHDLPAQFRPHHNRNAYYSVHSRATDLAT